MTPIEEFYRLAKDADRAVMSEDTRGDPDLEPFCLQIVDLTRRHPELRKEFVHGFQSVVRERSLGAWEIIMLCMHILRWPEIRSWAESRRQECVVANDWRGEPVYRQIIEAFEDGWDEYGIFDCLKAEPNRVPVTD